MTASAIQDLTRMIEELPQGGQAEVRELVERLWAESRRKVSGKLRQSAEAKPLSQASRRMLDLLKSWKSERLPPDEEQAFDDFETFQQQHPMRFAQLDEER